MSVDFDLFYEWSKQKFGEHNIKLRNTAHGTEICTNSPWSENKLGKTDNKFHLWMNPSGGKSKHPEFGSYRCWLTDQMGSLVGLVSELDKVDWEEAEYRISEGSSLRDLEEKVHDFFNQSNNIAIHEDKEEKVDLQLPPHSYLISAEYPHHFMKKKAEQYLSARKINYEDLYVCVSGEYKNRIVIPYYDESSNLIYYNARSITDQKNTLRYMKCPTSVVDQKNVLFMTNWNCLGEKLFIMEGEFDALTIKQAGLNACACGGKFLSETQIDLIKDFVPVLAFDSDEAGLEAMLNIGDNLLSKGFKEIYFVRPPKIYKDWNGLLVNKNLETLVSYVNKYIKLFTKDTRSILLANKI